MTVEAYPSGILSTLVRLSATSASWNSIVMEVRSTRRVGLILSDLSTASLQEPLERRRWAGDRQAKCRRVADIDRFSVGFVLVDDLLVSGWTGGRYWWVIAHQMGQFPQILACGCAGYLNTNPLARPRGSIDIGGAFVAVPSGTSRASTGGLQLPQSVMGSQPNAWFRSMIRSSGSSIPTEMRTSVGVIPSRNRSSLGMSE